MASAALNIPANNIWLLHYKKCNSHIYILIQKFNSTFQAGTGN